MVAMWARDACKGDMGNTICTDDDDDDDGRARACTHTQTGGPRNTQAHTCLPGEHASMRACMQCVLCGMHTRMPGMPGQHVYCLHLKDSVPKIIRIIITITVDLNCSDAPPF